jgi:tRNA A37 threonylcarbamoyladenosine biosynthesis protein TsaE
VVLVEWGERFPELMPEERVEITLRAVGGDEREIVILPRMNADERE